MNFFLSSLNEPQEDWEGENFIQRISSLICHSSRHSQVYNPSLADVVLFLESNRFKSRYDLDLFQKGTTKNSEPCAAGPWDSCLCLPGIGEPRSQPVIFRGSQKSDLLKHFAHKAYTLNYADAPIAFLPGLYVSLPRYASDPCWTRAIPYPWPSPNKQLQSLILQQEYPEYKFSFRGSLSHPVRQVLLDVMAQNPKLGPCKQMFRWFDHTNEEELDYLVELSKSNFVLCPRWVGTSTYRVYETLKLSRVPITISDDWVPPDSIDWNSFSIRISEERLAELSSLQQSYLKRWHSMSCAASSVWDKYFKDSVLADYLFVQLESLTFNRTPRVDRSYLKLRWRSASF